MRSRRWKFAASLGLLLCLSASIAVGGFAADASVAEQGYPGGGDWGRPSQAYGYAPDDSVLAPDGHYYKPNSWTTVSEATCINKEKQVRYCVWMEWDWWSLQYVQCNHADYGEVGEVDPNNHVNTITINKKEATCTETGVKTRTCKRDASHTETETIAKTGHDYTEKVVPPTCESDGYTIFTCNNCGDIYTGNVTTKLGHDYQLKDHKDATCTEAGYDYYECSRDALHNYTEAIPATDHMYGKEVVEPTCTEPGYTKYTCAYCGDSYTTDEKPELGHDPIAVPGKEPTCTETGLTEGSKCQRCGKTLTAQETIPALGHAWNTTSTGVDNCVNVSFRHENETITLCPICGVQNGTQRLNKVTLYTAHAKLVVLRGVLENGMEAMTVAFYEPGISSVTACQRCGAVRDSFSSGASLPQAAENAHFTVDASLVDGYTVMLVQADGTETVLTPGISDGKAIFDVDMKGQGARLLHLVPTTAA